jgi:hypothetical protein
VLGWLPVVMSGLAFAVVLAGVPVIAEVSICGLLMLAACVSPLLISASLRRQAVLFSRRIGAGLGLGPIAGPSRVTSEAESGA